MDPLNNHSGIRVSSSESCSLLCTANGSSTKQCEELESNSATNGWALLEMAAEVREKRKELGVREVVTTGSPVRVMSPMESPDLGSA